jgi:hypothetical protein
MAWILERTGSATWLGAATVIRFLPALLLGPYGGVVAERFEQIRLMVVLDLVSAIVMIAMAAEVASNGPVIAVILTTAVGSSLGTAYQPAAAAMTPRLVSERDLGAANALRNTLESVIVIAGPGLGALLLLTGSPALAIGVNAASFIVSAFVLSRVKARSEPVDVTEGGEAGPFAQMLVGLRAVTRDRTAAVLVAYSVIATAVFGADTVQFVVVGDRVLDIGGKGFGLLMAGLGVGGILAAPLAVRLERATALGPVILVGMACYCLPTLLFLVTSAPAAGFVLEIVRGAGTLVVDVLAITALQRSLPQAVLARVFGAFGSMLTAAVILGALIMPALIGGPGLTASLWVAGAGVPALCLLGVPALRTMDARAAERRAALATRVAALRGCELFGSTPEGAVEQLAGAAIHLDALDGEQIVAEGEPADAFYVVLRGSVHVSARGETA